MLYHSGACFESRVIGRRINFLINEKPAISLGDKDEDNLQKFNGGGDDELLDLDEFDEDENEIRRRQKLNSVATIFSLRMKFTNAS